MSAEHTYRLRVLWTGNRGSGTSGYRAYGREHQIWAEGKPAIKASADPAFRGDPNLFNPEELMVASLSGCHMLWYLHLCAAAGVIVSAYADDPTATMVEEEGGGGRFVEVVLRPRVALGANSDRDTALALHEDAHKFCFIAASVAFPVRCQPIFTDAGDV